MREAEREAKAARGVGVAYAGFGGIGKAVAGRFSDRAAENCRQCEDVWYVEEDGGR